MIFKNFKSIFNQMDSCIAKKYFSKKNQEACGMHLKSDDEHINVLFISAENDRAAGSFLSMANLCKYLNDKYSCNNLVILPWWGDGYELLDIMNIKHILVHSMGWAVPLFKTSKDYSNELNDKKSINRITIKINKFNYWFYYAFKAIIRKRMNAVAVKRIGDFIEEHNIDIVHINTTATYVGALAALEKNIPFVWHLREFLEEDHGLTTINRLEDNKLINKANRVIAISNSVKNKYIDIIDDDKLVCIPNGINSDIFYMPNKKILQNKKVILLMVGRFQLQKGQIEFAQACVKTYQKGYHNFEVWFIGRGEQEIMNRVEDIFKSAKLENIVKYLGYQSDVENYYKKADISFTCSESEAFGRVTVEAMLSGNLIIGANTAGTKELIADNETGLLYEQGNSDDLSEKIIYAINNPEQSRKMANKGREYMFENMTSEINADKIYELYKEVLSEL